MLSLKNNKTATMHLIDVLVHQFWVRKQRKTDHKKFSNQAFQPYSEKKN